MAVHSTEKPTVGRIVWVWMSQDDLDINALEALEQNVPFRADVLYVDPQGLATLEVRDHVGERRVIDEACVIFDSEPTDHHGDDESYACWMPYQKQAREKAERERANQEALKEEGLGT